jgi:hypothetical protein
MRVFLAVVCGAMALAAYASSRARAPRTTSLSVARPFARPVARPVARPPRLPLPPHFNRLSSYYRVYLN